MANKKYDVAAYIWPAYTGDEPRTRIFWPEGIGEWETVKNIKAPYFEGHEWPRKPLWGYVNEADPFVMEMEIEAAAAHGVNVFIYDWYWYDNRPFLEQCLDNGYLKARNNDKVKFYLMWANHTVTSLWHKPTTDEHYTIWDGAVNLETFKTICLRTIEKYFSHPSYYKIDGKPVYMIYEMRNLISGLGGIEETKKALEWFRNETVKAGFPGLELQVTLRSEHAMNQTGIDPKYEGNFAQAIHELEFDSVTHYQFCHITDTGLEYPQIIENVKKHWQKIDEKFKMPYYPHISVGWDTSPRFNHVMEAITRANTPANVKLGFELAKEYIDTHPNLRVPLITVNSWNEWTETSYLQPDDRNGYGYLEAIRDTFLK